MYILFIYLCDMVNVYHTDLAFMNLCSRLLILDKEPH